ncbi:MAG: HNH endonuclease [Pseudanabaenaceae cyanobacterium SKYGB_i_bin29]|nr:HNH endonuclease [Pseudanabaenaceae cyanobacterium SKYG29]MDW8420502.1 HNH endonuclease [Pseudanabaenaceae cyanobacterium SKYGB_i_bin29]
MTPRVPIPEAVRQYVFQRDNYRCCSCGATKDLTIDHIIPLAKGGTNDISNLQTLCLSCNARKNDRYDPRFRRYWTEY